MTETATLPGPATALSERPYPVAAVTDAERYWWHLARLRESRTRAQAAGHIAAALADSPPAAPDPSRDTTAWHDLAGYLDCLATALDGSSFCPCLCGGEEREAWEHLTATVTRSGFTAAWRPVGECLRRRAGLDGSQAGTGERDAFAAGQVIMVVSAILGAPWTRR